jgi:hypothetical protein
MAIIYCVHPIDQNLIFLWKLVRSLLKKYPSKIKYLKLSDSDQSHDEALEIIKSSTEDDLIFFLCHGGSDYLKGCLFYSKQRPSYEKARFISSDNIAILSGKKVICLSCNSNMELATMANQIGTKVFIGFGNILFDEESFFKKGKIKRPIVERSKYEIRQVLFQALCMAIDNQISFKYFVNYLKLLINKKCDDLILNGNRKKNLRVANFLIEFKLGIKLIGNGEIILRF